jgi:predicted nucleic acid-binding protein
VRAALIVYLDACALSRLTDDPSQLRVRQEAEAMEHFFRHVLAGKVTWIASSILEEEIRKNPNAQSREDALGMLPFAAEFRHPNVGIAERARFLSALGYGGMDALHLAMAEHSKVDLLLTTDDQFLRQAGRGLGNPSIRVANPLDYVKEVKP